MSKPLQETAKGTVLVTGANGYIAGQIIVSLLCSGYSVHGTVRSLSRTKDLTTSESPFYPYVSSGHLELFEVPDITVPGAFDEALSEGVTAIVHLAQPVLLDSDDAEYIMRIATQGTLNTAEAATRLASMRTFVLMSSVAAIGKLPIDVPRGHVVSANDWSDLDLVAEGLRAQGKPVRGQLAYAASKMAAERALWKFRDERAPGFTVTAINPVFVAGPPALPITSPPGVYLTTVFIYEILAGGDLPPPKGLLGNGPHVDVRDVARLTRFVVDNPARADGRRYLAASSWVCPQAVAEVLREAYPERKDAIKREPLGEEYRDDFAFSELGPQLDTQTVVDVTGEEWIPFKKTVLDTARAFSGLL